MPSRFLIAFLAIACLTHPAVAQEREEDWQPNENGEFLPDTRQETPLGEDELLAAFSGKTHRGTYNFKRKDIETFAFEETTSADGRTHHQHGDTLDTGTWRVKENVICFTYDNWDGSTNRFCFNIYKRGNCFYHFGLNTWQGGLTGNFTARSVHAGEIPDCEPAIV